MPLFSDLTNDRQRIYNLYKANSPHLGQQTFADYIGDELRTGRQLSASWEAEAKILDSVIALGSCNNETSLFRATFDDFVDNFINNDCYTYPPFMSTSTCEASLERHWSGGKGRIPVLLTITCPVNTPMIDGELNPAHCGYEQEMILGRGSRFHVVQRQDIIDRTIIDQIMGGFYSRGVELFRRYELIYL